MELEQFTKRLQLIEEGDGDVTLEEVQLKFLCNEFFDVETELIVKKDF
jgi:hypothetical protein